MTPWLRKFVLTTHITASVGWLGAILSFLALAVVGLISPDDQTVRATYLVMELLGWYALVPLSLASLLTGIVQSLGTMWGLFRHYWVLFKLLINLVATVVLFMYMQTLSYLADMVGGTTLPSEALRLSPVLHASVALLLLLVATILSVYKPRGLTPYGWRKQLEKQTVLD